MNSVKLRSLERAHTVHIDWLTCQCNINIDRLIKVKSLSPMAKQLYINRLKNIYYKQVDMLQEQLIRDLKFCETEDVMLMSFI